MKDFIRESWKTAAAFAAGSFILSLLVGLIARNPFGVVLFRAFLLGLLFAGLGAGYRSAIRRWLPELAPGAASGEAAGADGAAPAGYRGAGRGEKVDIVLPEENVLDREHYRSADRAAREDEPAAAENAAEAEAQALGELAEELGEDLPTGEAEAGTTNLQDSDAEPGDASASFMDMEESDAEEGPGGVPPSVGAAGIDQLPDIPSFEPPPAAGTHGGTGRAPVRARGKTPEDVMKGTLGGQDPATLARAIRTVLKKDEKG